MKAARVMLPKFKAGMDLLTMGALLRLVRKTEKLRIISPRVEWRYNFKPEQNSEESKLLKILKNPVKWIS